MFPYEYADYDDRLFLFHYGYVDLLIDSPQTQINERKIASLWFGRHTWAQVDITMFVSPTGPQMDLS